MKHARLIGLWGLFVFVCMGLSAQTSNLVVFNELKEDFVLIVNGQVINAVPALHVRVTGLRPSRYLVQAQYTNRSLPTQEVQITIGANREISYALTRPQGTRGVPMFEFLSEFSMGYFPIAPQASVSFAYSGPTEAPPASVPVVVPVVVPQPTPVPVIVEPQPPVIVAPVRPNPLPGYTGPIGCDYPMDPAAFADAKKSIAAKSFSETKLQLAKQVTRSNCLLTTQVLELMGLFTFESEKLDFAKFAYDFTYDRGNYYRINDGFGFESSIRELEKYLQGK